MRKFLLVSILVVVILGVALIVFIFQKNSNIFLPVTQDSIVVPVNNLESLNLGVPTTQNELTEEKVETEYDTTSSAEKYFGYVYGICLIAKNNSLKNGDSVQLVTFDTPQEVFQSTIVDTFSNTDDCGGLTKELEERYALYKLDSIPNKEIGAALAVFGRNVKFTKDGDSMVMDTNLDDQYEYISTCSGYEGINFFVWTGKPYISKIMWQYYNYSGYDMEATCPE